MLSLVSTTLCTFRLTSYLASSSGIWLGPFLFESGTHLWPSSNACERS
jgi:hypothetical protein